MTEDLLSPAKLVRHFFNHKKHLKLLSVLPPLVGVSLTGCMMTDSIATIDSGCLVFEPILYSAKEDSEETIKAVRIHNRIWQEVCENARISD